MEALKNTSMMLILAAVFYGAYQMFVSDPDALRQSDATGPASQEQVIHAGADSNQVAIPASLAATHQQQQRQQQQQQQLGATAGIHGNAANSGQMQNQMPTGIPAGNGIAGFANTNPSPTTPPSRSMDPMHSMDSANNGLNQANNLPAANQFPANTISGAQSGFGQAALPDTDTGARYATDPNSTLPPANRQVGFNETMDQPSDLLPIQSPNNGNSAQEFMGANPRLHQPANGNNTFAQQQNLKAQLAADMQTAGTEIQEGKLGNALHRLSMWYDRPLAEEDRNTLISWLDNLAGDAIYSTKHALTNAYQVQTGDTLGSIAMQFQVSPQLLGNINFYGQNVQSETPLQPGAQLKVVPGPLRAVANLQRQELTVYVGALYAGRFNFRVGNSAPLESSSHRITRVSTTGLPAADNVGQHAALSAQNPFGRFCMVVGEDFVMHSPGNNPKGNCLEFQESDMQQLMVLLSQGCEVQVLAAE